LKGQNFSEEIFSQDAVALQSLAQKDYDALLRNNPKDVTLLCERAMVHMEDNDVKALVDDILVSAASYL